MISWTATIIYHKILLFLSTPQDKSEITEAITAVIEFACVLCNITSNPTDSHVDLWCIAVRLRPS